jgi:N6-adenosine-specific RNA methylase IME4
VLGVPRATAFRRLAAARDFAALSPAEQAKVRESKLTIYAAKAELKKREFIDAPLLPSEKFRVIYADPPWKYNDTRGFDGKYGAAEAHYSCMSTEELCALPVKALAEDDAVLFLWVTSPKLLDSAPVINAWGFEYKTSFVWDKVRHNYGHYNSVRHELLLICTRGSCTPDVPKLFPSVQTIKRTGRHSEKPEGFRKIIDTLYPRGKRIELFARGKPVDGWEKWGNEVDG